MVFYNSRAESQEPNDESSRKNFIRLPTTVEIRKNYIDVNIDLPSPHEEDISTEEDRRHQKRSLALLLVLETEDASLLLSIGSMLFIGGGYVIYKDLISTLQQSQTMTGSVCDGRLPLEVMTLTPQCEQVETAQGVPLTVTGVAQCKVMTEMQFLSTAAEQFLGKDLEHIKCVILQTLEGHLRSILGTLSVEEVYRDREQFASLVREVAAPDVGRMGIEILSFTIKDVFDKVDYLASLGKARTAAVKRDADIGVSQAERDAGIREAECEKSAMDVKYGANTKIEDSHRMYQLQKANFDSEVNTKVSKLPSSFLSPLNHIKKAEAQLAYELQAARMKQKIRTEEIEIDVVERRKQISVEEKEILRKEKELMATVKLPAEAEAYRVEMIAQGERTQTVEVARADAERIKMIGAAEAYAIEAVGKAEAERMRMKAAAYRQYGDAAVMSLVLDALPKIAAEVAAPLGKTDEIVLVGGSDGVTSDVTRLVSQIPPAVHALTGVDLSKVVSKIPGAK
ncbi:FLOT2 [Cordylochernes scorpioides]|uniref:FLOT2 n=1 Tax=Cordylochernes scorpioides TaxID=51811 RepID=A0ABY6K717_9ARAC|nr:FLOT2 [Cordylochernes scorpioides]